jgi:hypothetical protein
MTDMRRLIDGDVGEYEADLLRSALDDAPSRGGRQKLLASLGVAGGTLAAAGVAKAAGTAGAAATVAGETATATVAKGGSGALAAVVGKWLGIGMVAGTVTAGAVVGVDHLVSAPAPSASAPEILESVDRGPLPSRRTGGGVSRSPAPASEQPEPSPERASPNGRTARPSSSVAAEVESLDRARQALERGDSRGALRALDRHQGRFQSGVLTPESQLIRIEALLASGKHAAAAAQARAFLAAHPGSAHTTRVRSLLRRAEGRGGVSTSPNVAAFPEEK